MLPSSRVVVGRDFDKAARDPVLSAIVAEHADSLVRHVCSCGCPPHRGVLTLASQEGWEEQDTLMEEDAGEKTVDQRDQQLAMAEYHQARAYGGGGLTPLEAGLVAAAATATTPTYDAQQLGRLIGAGADVPTLVVNADGTIGSQPHAADGATPTATSVPDTGPAATAPTASPTAAAPNTPGHHGEGNEGNEGNEGIATRSAEVEVIDLLSSDDEEE